MSTFSLTKTLLTSDEGAYRKATQSEFLRSAANGQTSKKVLGEWLANDRLYIHSYIRGLGRLISSLTFPDIVTQSSAEPTSTKLLQWAIDALNNIQREEKFFVETAERHGIQINLKVEEDGRVSEKEKLPGLMQWEQLFNNLPTGHGGTLPWFEAAVVFWGTEKCYLDAWSWAKSQITVQRDPREDQDGGALRNEFINNWTSDEFVAFVDKLGDIIDERVLREVESGGEEARKELLRRAEEKWREVLAAETGFWPSI